MNENLDAHPSDSLRFALLEITRTTSQRDEAERLMDALFTYFREPPNSKITEAEKKVTIIKSTLDLREREIKDLTIRIEAQARLIKESGWREEMNKIRQRLDEISWTTRGMPNG